MTQWVMVIDLRKCIGCGTCQTVCKQINNVPPSSKWRRVVEKTIENNNSERMFFTMSCMHCNNPSCLEVCPTTATQKSDDGIVFIEKKRCMGCGSCVIACPYDARQIAETDLSLSEKSRNSKSGPHKNELIGTCTKCDFCKDFLQIAISKGLSPDVSFDAKPRCVQYCISDALFFGDLKDPNSEVSKLIKGNKTIKLRSDLKTDPNVFYIVE